MTPHLLLDLEFDVVAQGFVAFFGGHGQDPIAAHVEIKILDLVFARSEFGDRTIHGSHTRVRHVAFDADIPTFKRLLVTHQFEYKVSSANAGRTWSHLEGHVEFARTFGGASGECNQKNQKEFFHDDFGGSRVWIFGRRNKTKTSTSTDNATGATVSKISKVVPGLPAVLAGSTNDTVLRNGN